MAQKQAGASVNCAIGEVVTSSITSLTAQCWQTQGEHGLSLVVKPNFGSFLKIASPESSLEIMAVVYNVITGPQDAIHRPVALGLSREQLRLEQPHIFALLRTEVYALIVGFLRDGEVYHHLPPQPPEVHDFVYSATPGEVDKITDGFDFLRLLSNCSAVPTDELLAASIRESYTVRGDDQGFLLAAGRALAALLRSDYDRLVCLLQKIKPGCTK